MKIEKLRDPIQYTCNTEMTKMEFFKERGPESDDTFVVLVVLFVLEFFITKDRHIAYVLSKLKLRKLTFQMSLKL